MAFGAVILFIFSFAIALVNGNTEGDILYSWRTTLNDPNNVLESWDPTSASPCTWYHLACNANGSVTRMDLGIAGLSGPISPLLGYLPDLQYMELFGNDFTGEIPATLGKLKRLVTLDLSQNKLSGSIPPTLGNLKSLRYLNLYDNNLTGVIPQEIGKATLLRRLDLYDNQLSGSIPATLGNLKFVRFMRLNNNALTGDLPAEVLDLVPMGNLKILNVSNNLLAGSKPKQYSKGLAVTTIIQDPKD